MAHAQISCQYESVTEDRPMASELRALLASPGLNGKPVKGVYFFPGELEHNVPLCTVHPLYEVDKIWNSVPSGRSSVIGRMLTAHANTIVMSYWSDLTIWSPMDVLPGKTLPGVLHAVQGRPLVIMPAIE